MRRCLNCGRDATPRFIYCSDECRGESLKRERERRELLEVRGQTREDRIAGRRVVDGGSALGGDGAS